MTSQFVESTNSDDEGNFWDEDPEEPEITVALDDIAVGDEYDGVRRTRCLFLTFSFFIL